eukprot:GEMP01062115.1.p1 GENE.GEMP01062115.1~~GEMP01062115.1.p1  ORF type:complete len:372 (+),score=40.39 GEMP01062115.1:199-1314(+)
MKFLAFLRVAAIVLRTQDGGNLSREPQDDNREPPLSMAKPKTSDHLPKNTKDTPGPDVSFNVDQSGIVRKPVKQIGGSCSAVPSGCATMCTVEDEKKTAGIEDKSWVGDDWNDKVGAINVKEGCTFTAYEHGNYRGMSEQFTGGFHNEGDILSHRSLSSFKCSCPGLVLIGSNSKSEGNVYVDDLPVCDDNWNNNAALVVCKMLGYGAGRSVIQSHFGHVANDFSMDDVECDGSETNIKSCAYKSNDDCSAGEGAGVKCGGREHEDCWEQCNTKSGPCDFCGVGNKCCRKNFNGGENGCSPSEGPSYRHGCITATGCTDNDADFKKSKPDTGSWANWSCREAKHDGYCTHGTLNRQTMEDHCRASCGHCGH